MSRKNGFIKEWLCQAVCRLLSLRQDSEGFVLMSTLAIFLVLFLFCSSIYAIGETIHQRIKLQNACDAAAYSAAVIQADGLSRMASINRAMSWTYVQMTNRQMDYITYRWLKLTCQQFDEDLKNAKKFSACLILPLDKEFTWVGMVIEAVVAYGAQAILDFLKIDVTCKGKQSGWNHSKEGLAYWCGRDGGTTHGRRHEIEMNNPPPDFDMSASGAFEAATKALVQRWFTKDKIESVLKLLPFGENGEILGRLIDYDKLNIKMMNNALPMINKLMTLSMKVSSENILKSSLKDRRKEDADILKDYHISIKIPCATNPYDVESVVEAVDSYFSALHNTEADEMLFLNMHSSDNADGSLPSFFPTLTGGSLAYGLDQWFIRGKGNYENDDEQGKLLGTVRSEGALGIQRVYKDANLNETKAGAFMREKGIHKDEKKFVYKCKVSKGTWHNSEVPNYKKVVIQPWIDSLPQCCRDNLECTLYSESNAKKHQTLTVKYVIHPHGKEGSHHPVSRSNHIVNLMGLLDTAQAVISSLGDNDDEDDDTDDGLISIESLEDLDGQLGQLDGEIAALKLQLEGNPDDPELQKALKEKQEQRDALETARGSYADVENKTDTLAGGGDSSAAGQAAGGDGGAMSGLMSLLTDFLSNLVGDVLDVQASCGNDPSLNYSEYPMCRHASGTYALYSQYRWGSAKWYCLTNVKSWFIGLIFDDQKIWCDWGKGKVKIARFWKATVKGKGHWHIPKWFCAGGPNNPFEQLTSKAGVEMPSFLAKFGEKLAKYFIPIPLPQNMLLSETDFMGKTHGYMKFTGDLANLIWPAGQFIGAVERIERDDFCSCVPFFGVPASVTPVGASFASVIQGHARIYGDDKRIFDDRYIGAKCKPWVLNERFFAEKGSIVVGAAMKHRNPFVQLFDFLNRQYTEEQNLPEGSLLSAYNIPKGNVMWTMSAARAGVRRHRRNGLFDQERQYQITYDPTSDVENLGYMNAPPFYFLPNGEGENTGSWKRIHMNADIAWDVDEPDNKLALSRADIMNQKTVAIWDGCPCSEENASAFTQMWNLCEWDWDATLIPLRYANVYARLKLEDEDGRPLSFTGERLDKLCYNDRRKTITEIRMTSNKNQELKSEKLRQLANNDDYVGDGRHWVWDMDGNVLDSSFSWSKDPFTVSAWKRANATFFEEAAAAAVQGASNAGGAALNNSSQDLDLKTKLPMEKDNGGDAEIRYLILLRSNRIL